MLLLPQLGYHLGIHAPGHVHPSDHWRVGHHVLLAHAVAVQHFRRLVPHGRISLNANTDYAEPLTDSQEDKVCCLGLVAGRKVLRSHRGSKGCCNHVEPLTDLQDQACCPCFAAQKRALRFHRGTESAHLFGFRDHSMACSLPTSSCPIARHQLVLCRRP